MLNQQVGNKSGARVLTSLVVAIILFGAVFSVVQAQEFKPNEDKELNPRGAVITGKVGMVVAGTGLELSPMETVNVDVPGSDVKAAYLYWSGVRNTNADDDYTVTLQVDGGVDNEIIALTVYGPSFWYSEDGFTYDHNTYVADVTNLIELGSHNYTFSDYDVRLGEPLPLAPGSKPYGFAIAVVYEDASLSEREIRLMDGLDSVYHGFTPPRGSPSAQNCFTFTPDSSKSRVLDFAVIASGVEITTPVRPNNLYYYSYTGPTPPDPPSSWDQFVNPFTSANGPEIDVFEDSVTVPIDHDTACFITESVNSDDPNGASFVWQVGAYSLHDPVTTVVNLQSITAVSPNYLLITSVIGILFLLVPTAVVVTNRRKKK